MSDMRTDEGLSEVFRLAVDYEDYSNGEIVRYNGKHKIKQETIAEHGFMVALNIMKVCKALNISDEIRDKAVTMGVLHDISEKYVGDIAYEFKHEKQNKGILDELFDNYEKKLYEEKYVTEYGEIYKDVYEGNNCVPDRLVKLGDSMSVVQYSGREIALGNTTRDMAGISEAARDRVRYDYRRLMQAIGESEDRIG